MIRTLALVGAAALLASAAPAFAQYAPHSSMGPHPAGPPAAGPPASHAPPSDEFERKAGDMAGRMAASPKVRDFGAMMVRDHTKTTQELQAAIRSTGHSVPPPPPLSGAQQHMLDQLRSAGPNFDAVYLQQQVQAHQQALSTLQDYARDGHNQVLRQAARRTIPLVQNHLAMAQQLQASVRH